MTLGVAWNLCCYDADFFGTYAYAEHVNHDLQAHKMFCAVSVMIALWR